MPADQIDEMLIKKIKQCRIVFDFTKALSDVSQKDIKRDSLIELVEYFTTSISPINMEVYKEMTEMVGF